jgi:hypothetical protein
MAVQFNGEPEGGGNPLSRLPPWAWALGIGGIVGVVFLLKRGSSGAASGSPSNGVPLNAAVALGDLQSELLNQQGSAAQATSQLGADLSNKLQFAQEQLDASFQYDVKQTQAAKTEQDAIYNYLVKLGGSLQQSIGQSEQALATQNQDYWNRFWPYLLALMTKVGVSASDFGLPPAPALGQPLGDPNHPAAHDAGPGQ